MLPKDTLIIQAEKNGEYFELIPHECFKDDLPLRLVEDYAHWFCQTSGTIEFRLKTHPWTQSDTLPTLSISSRELSDLQRRFIDPISTTAQKLYLALQSLERETNIEIFIPVQNDNFSVEVYLPRLKLGFYVNRDNPTHIYSHQFNDMIIDLNQDISTFVGLKNKLVLRPALNMDMHRAKVLVPFGDVKFTLFEKNHVEISIETPDNSVIEYHAYDIDIHLQRRWGQVSRA